MKVAVVLALAAGWSIMPLAGQDPDDRAPVLIAAIEHLRAERLLHPGYQPGDQSVIDPGDALRAEEQFMRRLASLTHVRIARTQDVRVCTEVPDRVPECRLVVGRVFRLHEIEVGAEGATVHVEELTIERWRHIALGHLVTLRRMDNGWVVADVRMLWRS